MAGASLTLTRLDDELRALLDAPAQTPFFVQA
jgi:dihydroxyacetone kinase-like protein